MSRNIEFGNFEQKAEDEFRAKVEEIAMYQGNIERYTIDREWTEEELKEDVMDEALKILKGTKDKEGWLTKTTGRAKLDKDLDYPEFLANKVIDEYDLIEEYNKQVDKHRNDEVKKFGIHYFDEWCIKTLNKILKDNLITK